MYYQFGSGFFKMHNRLVGIYNLFQVDGILTYMGKRVTRIKIIEQLVQIL